MNPREQPADDAHTVYPEGEAPAPAGDSLGGGLYIDELFEEFSALSPAEREQAFAARCAGHPSVEAEVRALLDAVGPEDEDASEELALEEGTVVGRYKLEQRIGAGATASVWKAYDTHLQSFTALKLLHPDGRIRGSMALEAVLREARAASSIISDHVVRIKTAGRFDRGPHYVDMELCAEHRPAQDGGELLQIGRTLSDAELTNQREIVRVVAEAARGVDAAHRVGVLHRDLKPGNILLTPVSRRAKVTDFGLAAETLSPAPTPDTPATATVTVMLEARDGRIVGTPAYMAPEQALGHPATRAGDVYALGATLYALLARRPPYEPNGKQPVPALDVLNQVREAPPEPVTKWVRVPRRLAAIVERAMARSPRRRYQTALDLAQDLELWLAHRPTSVDGRAPLLRVGLFVRRNRGLVSSVAVLGGALLLFALAVGWLEVQRRELVSAIDLAEVRLTEAEGQTAAAEAVRERTLVEKEQALAEARDADLARLQALSGQSDAEDRAKRAWAAREAAEKARAEAERLRKSTEADRDVALMALRQAQDELDAAKESEALAVAQADDDSRARVNAEADLRSAQVALNASHLQRQSLEQRVALLQAALESAEADVEKLNDELRQLRAGPVRTEPIDLAPEPEPAPGP
ncbi:MAG: protein kinase [Myxococcota bacterium]